MTSGVWLRAALLFSALLLAVSRASGQSYGPEAQRLTIGAAEFRPFVNYNGLFLWHDGYISLHPPSESPSTPTAIGLLAPVALPEGASIDELCLYANDTDLIQEVRAFLVAAKLVPPGENAARKLLVEVSSNAALGYRRYCMDLAEVVRGRIDVDEDGIVDDAAYYVLVSLPYDYNELQFTAFGGVQINWRRAVSPPPSAPTFTDVPTSGPFYPFIEALAQSGITAGCGDGTDFCPNAPLMRGHMAVFLSKALGLYWPD